MNMAGNLLRPPDLATATTPRTGNPMAVTAKPAMAIQIFVPADAPKKGGKIRFPAPKNMEKSVRPTKTSFCFGNRSICPFYLSPAR